VIKPEAVVTPDERQVEREIWIALERLVTRMENFFAWRQAARKYGADQARWPAGSPAGSPDSVGGRFAPENGGTVHGNYLRTGRRPVQLAFAGDATQLAQLLQANQSFGPRPAADTSCKDQDYDDYYPQIGFPRLDEPPCHRRSVAEVRNSWADFKNAVDQLGDTTPQERLGYMEFFAAEGGTRPDTSNGAVGGIVEQTLRQAKASGKIPGLENVTDPAQLTDEQRAQIYQWALDDRLFWATDDRTDGRRRIGEINSPYTAAAVVDTLLRNSRRKGAGLVQEAINDVLRTVPESERRAYNLEALSVDGKLGRGTFDSLLALEALGYGPHFREALADRRATAEKPRNDHFRFRGKP
jgi:hypothetical protein